MTYPIIDKLKRTLIVSCQASSGEPLASPEHITALAQSAIKGGAGGLRLEGIENVKAVRSVTDLPIIGLIKSKSVPDDERLSKVYITASFAEAQELAEAGADIIAIDGTARARADDLSLEETISRIHKELDKPVLADVSTVEEGINAEKAGADIVSTTLCGYTLESKLPTKAGPAISLLEQLCKYLKMPVILEGRVWFPEEAGIAIVLGAHSVVVGSAITRPQLITERFVQAIPSIQAKKNLGWNLRQIAWMMTGILAICAPILLTDQLKSAHNQRFPERIKHIAVTPLNKLNTIANSDELVHIEAYTIGNPQVLSDDEQELAFQQLLAKKFDLNPIANRNRTLIRYYPQYYCVSDNKGFLWIDSSDFNETAVQFKDTDWKKTGIAKRLQNDFEIFLHNGKTVDVSTIRRGEHISALGQVSWDSSQNRYVLHKPANALNGEVFLMVR